METLELEKSTNKINPQLIIPSDYIDLNQYDSIPALDRAIASGFEPEVCNSWEEYVTLMKKWKEEWDAEDD